MNKTIISEVLCYLEEIGWADLIDSRYKDYVISDIRSKFPNISPKDLQKVLDLVLC